RLVREVPRDGEPVEGSLVELSTAAVIPGSARPGLDELASVARDCGADVPPPAQLGRVRRFLEPVLARRYDHAEARLRGREQLEHPAAGLPPPGGLPPR